jgi:hypothetical protein
MAGSFVRIVDSFGSEGRLFTTEAQNTEETQIAFAAAPRVLTISLNTCPLCS